MQRQRKLACLQICIATVFFRWIYCHIHTYILSDVRLLSVFFWNVMRDGQRATDAINIPWDGSQKWMNPIPMQQNRHSKDMRPSLLSWGCSSRGTIFSPTCLHPNSQTSPSCISSQRRICKKSFQNEHHPSCYMLSQNIMPLLLGYQFCSCWKRERKSKVTQGVILMGPVMRVDRLRHGGGWALTRCCLQIGFLQVRHPCWVISHLEQPLSHRMICY